MSDERIVRSVRELRIFQRRSKEAGQRNKAKRCQCQSGEPSHLVKSKKRGERRIILSRHGALHGVFGQEGCPHSTLRETTRVLRLIPRDPLEHLPTIPTVILR